MGALKEVVVVVGVEIGVTWWGEGVMKVVVEVGYSVGGGGSGVRVLSEVVDVRVVVVG